MSDADVIVGSRPCRNWDCITDLNWLRGLSYLIIFDSAEYLLSESDRGFRILLEVLTDAQNTWHRERPTSAPTAASRSNPYWRATLMPLTH